ncbi:hypothetical protein [Acidovorax sp.]|uniref:hypothetical protein n=1 Tax=Acidovorax sp. TaxID=1872122 RepID=UPI00391FAD96
MSNEKSVQPHANVVRLLGLLAKAGALSVEEGPLLSNWKTAPPNGDDLNQVVHIVVHEEGMNISYCLTEGGIAEGNFGDDGSFTCPDIEGDRTLLRMYWLIPFGPEAAERPALDSAIAALSTESISQANARAALVRLRDDIERHDGLLDRQERVPTGDDYNILVERLRAP